MLSLIGEPARLIEQALEILDEVGILFEDEATARLLASKGGRAAGDRIRIGPDLVRQALETVPSQFSLFDRSGNLALDLGTGVTSFNPGSAALHVLDPGERHRREATRADIVRLIRLTQALPHLAAQSTALVPSDVVSEASDRYRLYLALLHGTKPVVTGVFSLASLPAMMAMLTSVRGSRQALVEKPLALLDCCPSSPLRWSALSCKTLLEAASAGQPVNLIAAPLTGATSPVTLRETLVQHCAENLAGLTLTQFVSPGARVVFGGAPVAFDMRQGSAPFSAPESILMNAANASIARELDLPSHGYLALSDARLSDYQAGMESTAGAILAVLSGISLVSGPGLLDYVMTLSLEKLVLDHEACKLALRVGRGISDHGLDVLSLARVLVERGELLSSSHTRQLWRKELSVASELIERRAYSDWESSGASDAAERAREQVERLLREPTCETLPDALASRLEELAVRGCERP